MSEKHRQAFSHGGDVALYTHRGKTILDFSANTSPLGLPFAGRLALVSCCAGISQYPDPYCRKLISAISLREQISDTHIVCGNGATELIYAAAHAVQPRRNDARIVDDQRVPGIQVVDDVVEVPVLDGVRPAVEHHQPAVVARLDGRLRDALLGQVVHEIRELHSDSFLYKVLREPLPVGAVDAAVRMPSLRITAPERGLFTSCVAVRNGQPAARTRSITARPASVVIPRCQ